MIEYKLKTQNLPSRYLQISITFEVTPGKTHELILPAWRPGRYEGAEYVKKVRQLKLSDGKGDEIILHRKDINVWSFTSSSSKVVVDYFYLANQLDAGGTYIDDDLFLLNPVSCFFYLKGQEEKKITLDLEIPADWDLVTTLEGTGGHFTASNFEAFSEKPILAGSFLKKYDYDISGTPFQIAVYGKPPTDLHKLIPSFKKFSEAQRELFGSFPFKQYIFITVILPFRFYHGVEHDDNTVLVLGVDESTDPQKFIDDLLGVASHELFHTWNIKKIRPKVLSPYSFEKTPIFDGGIIAEGVTTYYGDLFLARAGIWNKERFIQELNVFLKRHFRNIGRHVHSLVTSSENLLVDGYSPGPPYHKVSIYVKGALVTMMLDFKIRLATESKYSFDDVLLELNKRAGSGGYDLNDIREIAEKLVNEDFNDFFKKYVYGVYLLEEELADLAQSFGLELVKESNTNILERVLGVALVNENDQWKIQFIDPESQAYQQLAIGDQVVAVNDKRPDEIESDDISGSETNLIIKRTGRKLEVNIRKQDNEFLPAFQFRLIKSPDNSQKVFLDYWLGK